MKFVVRLPESRDPPGAIAVGIRAVPGIRLGRAQEIPRLGGHRCARRVEPVKIRLIDESGFIVPTRVQAYCPGVGQRNVKHAAYVFVEGLRVLGLAETCFHLCVEACGVRGILHESDGAAERARAVEGSLGTPQNLDVIQVLQPQIDEERGVIHVGGDGRHDGSRQRDLSARGFAIQSTDDQRGAVDAAEGSLIGEVHPRHRIGETGNILDSRLIESRPADRRDADRQILRGYGTAACCYDDLVQCLFVRDGRCAIQHAHDCARNRRHFFDPPSANSAAYGGGLRRAGKFLHGSSSMPLPLCRWTKSHTRRCAGVGRCSRQVRT